jgi:hypothetical protein
VVQLNNRVQIAPAGVYIGICIVLGLLMVGHTTNQLWSDLDFWVWLGPVREFAARPLNPTHPLVAVDAPDSYMGPYTFVLGGLTRLTGADPVNVMAIAGLANLGLLVAGLWHLTRRVSTATWAPPLALLFTLVAWGWKPWQWSGYPNLNSLGIVLPLGSTFAYGTGLIFLAALWEWLHAKSIPALALAAVTFPITLLSHPVTGFWVALIAIGFVGSQIGTITTRQWVLLSTAAFLGLSMVVLWPYYSVSGLVGGTGGFDGINGPTYNHVVARAVLGIPGIVILAWRFRRNRSDPLALAALLVGFVFCFGWITARGSLGRVFPALMLLAHLAMADWFASRLSSPRSRLVLRLNQGVVAAIILLGLIGAAPGWLRTIPRALVPENVAKHLQLQSYVEPNLQFAAYFDEDDVIAATSGAAIPIGGVAAKVLSVDIPEPFIDDAAKRSTDVQAMLNPATPPVLRKGLIDEYDPGWIVVPKADATRLVEQLPGASVRGEVNGFTVIRLLEDAETAPSRG